MANDQDPIERELRHRIDTAIDNDEAYELSLALSDYRRNYQLARCPICNLVNCFCD